MKSTSKRIVNILYHPYYSKGSLYGAGVFPFWLYIKYFGKPVYKFCRKRLKLPKFFSVMASNLLGSAAHVGFFVSGFSWALILVFLISLFGMTLLFMGFNKISWRWCKIN